MSVNYVLSLMIHLYRNCITTIRETTIQVEELLHTYLTCCCMFTPLLTLLFVSVLQQCAQLSCYCYSKNFHLILVVMGVFTPQVEYVVAQSSL